MATTKTTQERIKELDMKLEQIKAQKKQLANRAKAEETKGKGQKD